MRRVSATAPGKLFLAGEYAVTVADQEAVLIAVDRRLRVVLSTTAQHEPIPGKGWRYVRAARRVMAALATAHGAIAEPYRVQTFSDLEDYDIDGTGPRKYGLGSSAAVTVAMVVALDRWYGLALSPSALLEAALITTRTVSPTASGADVATSLTGGWVSYRSPGAVVTLAPEPAEIAAAGTLLAPGAEEVERVALAVLGGETGATDRATAGATDRAANRAENPARSGAEARRLAAPSFAVEVGWTGRPVLTTAQVGSVAAAGGVPPAFLERSGRCVSDLRDAVAADDRDGAGAAVRGMRQALAGLTRDRGVVVETPELAALADAAERLGGAGKSSGAGGGDCGIAVGVDDVAALHELWRAAGVTPLPLRVDDGARLETGPLPSWVPTRPEEEA